MNSESGLLDVGLQAERTTLAWQRTGTGVIVIGLLVTRWSVTEGFPAWPGAILAGVGALAGLVLVRRRYHRILYTVSADKTPLSRFMVPGTTLLVLLTILGVAIGFGFEIRQP